MTLVSEAVAGIKSYEWLENSHRTAITILSVPGMLRVKMINECYWKLSVQHCPALVNSFISRLYPTWFIQRLDRPLNCKLVSHDGDHPSYSKVGNSSVLSELGELKKIVRS